MEVSPDLRHTEGSSSIFFTSQNWESFEYICRSLDLGLVGMAVAFFMVAACCPWTDGDEMSMKLGGSEKDTLREEGAILRVFPFQTVESKVEASLVLGAC